MIVYIHSETTFLRVCSSEYTVLTAEGNCLLFIPWDQRPNGINNKQFPEGFKTVYSWNKGPKKWFLMYICLANISVYQKLWRHNPKYQCIFGLDLDLRSLNKHWYFGLWCHKSQCTLLMTSQPQINTDIGKKNYNCGASQIHKKLYYDNSEGNMEYQVYNFAKKNHPKLLFSTVMF